MEKKMTIALAICLMVFIGSSMVIIRALSDYSDMHRSEGLCIAEHIQDGIERKDIYAFEGKCYVKGN